MDTKSETPRTDAVTFRAFEHDSKTELEACLVVPADEMAKLELELTAAKREVGELTSTLSIRNDEVAGLIGMNEELKRDKERLDWLDNCYDYQIRPKPMNQWLLQENGFKIRQAIDNAVKEEK